MRKLFLGVVVACALSSSLSAQAQYDPSNWFKPACPTCRVEAAADWVGPVDTGGGQIETVVAGWGFRCSDGLPVDRVEVWYEDQHGGGHAMPSELRYTGIARPDVTYYSGVIGCGPAYNAGFGVVLQAPTSGYRAVIINVWRGSLKYKPIRIALR